MIDSNLLNDISAKIAQLIPKDLQIIKQDLEKNIRAILQSSLHKLDLVTREEFETQQAVLEKTRQKLEALEKQIQTLENNSNG